MTAAWSKVGDEVSVPERLNAAESEALLKIFDSKSESSPWRIALGRLGLPPSLEPALKVDDGIAYFNSAVYARLLNCGTLRLLLVQWKLEKFIHSLKEELPATDAAKIEESVVLGLAVQILMMRLPSADPKDLGIWLALPEQAPRAARPTVERIEKLVRRRNRLSPAWKSIFPREAFPEADEAQEPAEVSRANKWKGIPIVAGKIRGTFVLIDPLRMPKDIELPQGPLILCFTKARPESVEFFPRAQAVAFAEGGAVAHACSIARERNLPCVSGLGPDFAAAIKSWAASSERVELTLDGAAGSVSLTIP